MHVQAIAFCVKHGWGYEVTEPTPRVHKRSKRFQGYGKDLPSSPAVIPAFKAAYPCQHSPGGSDIMHVGAAVRCRMAGKHGGIAKGRALAAHYCVHAADFTQATTSASSARASPT